MQGARLGRIFALGVPDVIHEAESTIEVNAAGTRVTGHDLTSVVSKKYSICLSDVTDIDRDHGEHRRE